MTKNSEIQIKISKFIWNLIKNVSHFSSFIKTTAGAISHLL
jgi:hypothetical protein